MPLFQSSVITKYLKSQNEQEISEKWNVFKNHFHNPKIQENIRESKEEQYQGEFLIDLFVNVLGYTKNPTPNFNLTTEYKNVKDSKKADGAIIIDEIVKAVIELKGTNTTDLNKIEVQAFGYKNNQPDCTYVITSNFEKLRFYIDNAIDHIEFNLFTLTEKEFEVLYLCLAYENIKKDTPKVIKRESVSQEDAITKNLYKDYSVFKRELHLNLVELNPQFDTITLFTESQKLLDRFLFLFFAEDRQLLPPNSVRLILKQWNKLKELDAYTPLFDRFKKYFGYLNTGFKGKQYDVYAYNGGLFKPDDILDTVVIDDDILYKHTLKLSEYDFASEVDVNILGHIFENSLNELDEIKAELEGQEVDKSKGKRKKDGVFYTPKYITKYMVENTVDKLCDEKKVELNIVEDDYTTDKKRQKKTIKGLIDKLTEYRNWLLQITICDPACGSGAFLNQALDFLIAEHRYIDELQAKLFGDAMVLSDVEKSILENNLFGVDLNEESVEIAKLSLWLRTAQPNRKLNDLNNNIKCGNSLIDDPAIGGDKAFNWQKEFPQIFAKGGFDVVIGNPPYVVIKGGRWVNGFEFNKKAIDFIKNKFETAEQQINTYILFLELSKHLVKQNGMVSQITPNTFFANEYSKKIRNFLITEANLLEINNTGLVFEDASVETAITTFRNNSYKNETTIINGDNKFKFNILNLNILTEDEKYLINLSKDSIKLLLKLSKNTKTKSIAKVWRGLTTGNDKKYLATKKISDIYKPILTGSEIQRYYHFKNKKYVLYDPKLLDRARDERIFVLKEKLISKFVGSKLTFCYDSNQNYVINTACSLELIDTSFSIKYLLCLMNSKLLNFYYQMVFSDSRSTFPIMKSGSIEQLPIKKTSIHSQQLFITKADKMLSLNKELQEIIQKFQKYLQSSFFIEKLSKKLQNWDNLEFQEFIKELNKAIKKENKENLKLADSEGVNAVYIPTLTKKDEFEWLDLFEENKQKAQELQSQINQVDKEIDAMVYELYGLTQEEIEIVENS